MSGLFMLVIPGNLSACGIELVWLFRVGSTRQSEGAGIHADDWTLSDALSSHIPESTMCTLHCESCWVGC